MADWNPMQIQCAIFVAGLAASWGLGRTCGRSRGASVCLSALGLLFLGASILLLRRQDLAVRLARTILPLGDWILLLQVWFAWPATFMLAALQPWLESDRDRRAVRVFTGLIAAAALGITCFLALRPFASLSTERPGNLCVQSTGWSCGAASAVNFLRLGCDVGASEEEMGQACGVLPIRGVTMAGAWWGIQQKIRPRRLEADLIRPTFEDLLRMPMPVLLPVRYGILLDHMVVLVEVGEKGLRVSDPTVRSLVDWSQEDLRTRWLGEAIVVRRSQEEPRGS
jgi:predicted double-glycine peptidase